MEIVFAVPPEYVTNIGQLLCWRILTMSLKPIAKSVVTNLKRLVAPRFGQLHRIVESCEARIVRWVWIRR